MAKKDDDKGTSDLSFEDAIKDLTQIVAKIEGGETPLEDSIAQYERGMSLIKHCRGILQSAEKKIEKISARDTQADDDDKQAEEELF